MFTGDASFHNHNHHVAIWVRIILFGGSFGGLRRYNLPSMQETQVQSLGPEDSLQKGKATHSRIPVWEIAWTRAWRATVCGVARVGHD